MISSNPVNESKQADGSIVDAVIIILNWNRPLDTIECLESLSTIGDRRFRHIILDNGSEDSSVEIMSDWLDRLSAEDHRAGTEGDSSHARIRWSLVASEEFGSFINRSARARNGLGDNDVLLISSLQNLGFARGNNEAFRFCRELLHSRYVLFLNNDVVVEPMAIEQLVLIADSTPRAGLIGPFVVWYGSPQRAQHCGGRIDLWTGRRIPRACSSSVPKGEAAIPTDYISGAAMLVRTSMLDEIGVFDESYFMYTEDVDLCYRAKRSGYSVIVVPNIRIQHKMSRSSGGSTSPFVDFYIYRNSILFMKKHARWYHWPTYLVVSFSVGMLRFVAQAIENPKRSAAMMRGAMHGLLGK